MPVEIRELVIRANVEEERERSASESESRGNTSGFNKTMTELRELKQMLKEKNERKYGITGWKTSQNDYPLV